MVEFEFSAMGSTESGDGGGDGDGDGDGAMRALQGAGCWRRVQQGALLYLEIMELDWDWLEDVVAALS